MTGGKEKRYDYEKSAGKPSRQWACSTSVQLRGIPVAVGKGQVAVDEARTSQEAERPA
jgi:hypothetical protein